MRLSGGTSNELRPELLFAYTPVPGTVFFAGYGGSVVDGLITAFGLAVTLRQWPAVWTALRLGGGLYLFWLALRSLLSAFAPSRAPVPPHSRP